MTAYDDQGENYVKCKSLLTEVTAGIKRGETMSIIVKGMHMPESCLECMNYGFRTAVKCAEWTEISAGRRENERAWSCPLVDLGKHGDLIDRDALPRFFMDFDVWNAPTIIEAEGE